MNQNILLCAVIILVLVLSVWAWRKNKSGSEFNVLVAEIREKQKNITGDYSETDRGTSILPK